MNNAKFLNFHDSWQTTRTYLSSCWAPERFLPLLQITVQTTACSVRVMFILLALRQFFFTWTCVVMVDFANCFNLFCICEHRTWRVWTPRWRFCLWAFVHLSTKIASRMDIWKEFNGPTHQWCAVQIPKWCVSDYITTKMWFNGRKKTKEKPPGSQTTKWEEKTCMNVPSNVKWRMFLCIFVLLCSLAYASVIFDSLLSVSTKLKQRKVIRGSEAMAC